MSGCEFKGSGWGWDRRCQDPGARGLGPGGGGRGGPIPSGGVATQNTGPYVYIYIYIYIFTSYHAFAHLPFLLFFSLINSRGPPSLIFSELLLPGWAAVHRRLQGGRKLKPAIGLVCFCSMGSHTADITRSFIELDYD